MPMAQGHWEKDDDDFSSLKHAFGESSVVTGSAGVHCFVFVEVELVVLIVPFPFCCLETTFEPYFIPCCSPEGAAEVLCPFMCHRGASWEGIMHQFHLSGHAELETIPSQKGCRGIGGGTCEWEGGKVVSLPRPCCAAGRLVMIYHRAA